MSDTPPEPGGERVGFRCEKCGHPVFEIGEMWTNRQKDGPGKITWLELTCLRCRAHETNVIVTTDNATALYAYLQQKIGDRTYYTGRLLSAPPRLIWRLVMWFRGLL